MFQKREGEIERERREREREHRGKDSSRGRLINCGGQTAQDPAATAPRAPVGPRRGSRGCLKLLYGQSPYKDSGFQRV